MAEPKANADQDIEWLTPETQLPGGGKTSAGAGGGQITAPRVSDFIPTGSTLGSLASGAAEGVGNLLTGIPSAIAHPIDTLKGAGHQIGTTYDLARQGQYIPAVATGLGLLGFNEPEMAKEWSSGEGARAIGQSIAPAAALAYGGEKALGRGDVTVAGTPITEHIPMPTDIVIRHPEAVKNLATVGGMAVAPYLEHGGTGVGEIGGYFGGRAIGTGIVKAADMRAIEQVIQGSRPLEQLPDRLLGEYNRIVENRAKGYLDRAAQQGKPIETYKIPVGVQNKLQQIEEERARMVPVLPRGVLTPEEEAAQAQTARYYGAVGKSMEPEGKVIGSAHQTYRHETEFVPSKRGTSATVTEGFKVRPKLSITER